MPTRVTTKPTKKGKPPSRTTKSQEAAPADALSRSLDDLLRQNANEVVKMMLDMAKKGDVRAAALVMKLLEKTAQGGDLPDDNQAEEALAELEARLSALPPALAQEVLGALAKTDASSRAASGRGRPRARGPAAGPGDLRGLPHGDSSDPGESAVSSLSLSEEAPEI